MPHLREVPRPVRVGRVSTRMIADDAPAEGEGHPSRAIRPGPCQTCPNGRRHRAPMACTGCRPPPRYLGSDIDDARHHAHRRRDHLGSRAPLNSTCDGRYAVANADPEQRRVEPQDVEEDLVADGVGQLGIGAHKSTNEVGVLDDADKPPGVHDG